MEFHIARSHGILPLTLAPFDYDRMRFFIRKTLHYGFLTKMRYHSAYEFTYHSSFSLGFSFSVVVSKPLRKPVMSNVKAVVIENDVPKRLLLS